jgi:hypothetical protein
MLDLIISELWLFPIDGWLSFLQIQTNIVSIALKWSKKDWIFGSDITFLSNIAETKCRYSFMIYIISMYNRFEYKLFYYFSSFWMSLFWMSHRFGRQIICLKLTGYPFA